MKKLVSILVILGLAGGGLFYWWQNQADVRVLNKTLPEGVRVEKSLFGEEYKVVNKIDGYEFKVPVEWGGVEEVVYVPEREEANYKATSIIFASRQRDGVSIGIDRYTAGGDILNTDLRLWAETNFETFELVGEFTQDTVEKFDVVKTQENIHFAGEYIYFLKINSIIYTFTAPSERVIQSVITNGKW